jgi:hypothetical protein
VAQPWGGCIMLQTELTSKQFDDFSTLIEQVDVMAP